jgi:hypothetical protein
MYTIGKGKLFICLELSLKLPQFLHTIKHFSLYKIKCILDGSRLYPAVNPLVGKSFKLVCNTEVTIVSTVTIKFPDGKIAGTCVPELPPFSFDCAGAAGYVSALNETENTVTISTNSLAADVSGTWTCTHTTETVSYTLTAPIRGKFSVHCL